MNQNEINRAVANTTGETVTEIRRRGFQLLEPEHGIASSIALLDVKPDDGVRVQAQRLPSVDQKAAIAS